MNKWCNTILDLNSDNFPKNRSEIWWHSYRCKKCTYVNKSDCYKYEIQRKLYEKKRSEKYNIYSWMVYVLECEWFYKIWCTKTQNYKSLSNRLKNICIWNPFEVKLLWYIFVDDSYYIESIFHRKFIDKKVRWERFNISKEEAEMVLNYKK